MNFALTPKHSGSSSKRVLILQAEQTRAVAHPSSACCTFVDTCESASAGGARFLCRDFEQKKKRRTRPIDLAGELASHSCAVSQLLVGRRHRFGICVPETQSGPAVCHNAPPAGRKIPIRGPSKRITSAAPRAYESDHQ